MKNQRLVTSVGPASPDIGKKLWKGRRRHTTEERGDRENGSLYGGHDSL